MACTLLYFFGTSQRARDEKCVYWTIDRIPYGLYELTVSSAINVILNLTNYSVPFDCEGIKLSLTKAEIKRRI